MLSVLQLVAVPTLVLSRLLIGCVELGGGGAGLPIGCVELWGGAGLRRVLVVITMPVRVAGGVWPLRMRSWWMGVTEDGAIFAATITGLWSSWGAAIMGGGAGAMGTLVHGTDLGRAWTVTTRQRSEGTPDTPVLLPVTGIAPSTSHWASSIYKSLG